MAEDDKKVFGEIIKGFKEKVPLLADTMASQSVKIAAAQGVLSTPEGEKSFRENMAQNSEPLQKLVGDINSDNQVTARELAAATIEGAALVKDRNGDGIVTRDEVKQSLQDAKTLLESASIQPVIAYVTPEKMDALIELIVPKEGIKTTQEKQQTLLQAEAGAKEQLGKPDEVVIGDVKALLSESFDKALTEYKDGFKIPNIKKFLELNSIPESQGVPTDSGESLTAPKQPEATQRPVISAARYFS
jgi:hypothetical protein